ncbi:MAG: tetratricopeptide repeat protein, partial [Paludibacteraceae bacterium]|nr:tetratricopeptide repeat protein [Paludibacteraceae bacterium]
DDADMRTGLELFQQEKYAAAADFLQRYLQQTATTDAIKIDEARFYLAATDYMRRRPDALDNISDFLIQHPYSNHASQLHLMAGVLLIETNKPSNMKYATAHLQAIDPKGLSRTEHTDYLYYRGVALQKANRHQDAEPFFEQLLGEHTRYDAPARYGYAYSLYAQQKYSQALPHFIDVERYDEYKDIAPYYICQIYYAQGKYDEVTDRALRLIQKNKNNPDNSELYRILGETYYRQGDYEQAIDYLQRYEQTAGKVARQDMYLLGMGRYHQGQYREAVNRLKKVTTTRDSLCENAYLNIGNSYIRLGETSNARMAFAEACKTNFDPAIREEAMYNYAVTTYQTTDALGESAAALINFLNSYPESGHAGQVYDCLNDALIRTKTPSKAYETLQQLKQQDARLDQARQYLKYQMGCESYSKGQTMKAVELFTEVIGGKKSDFRTDSYYWRGESYYRAGKYADAAADMEQYLNLTKGSNEANSRQAWYTAGYALFNQKQYSKAQTKFLTYLDKVDKTDKTYPDALNRVADCYFVNRSYAQAENYYNKTIATGKSGADYAMLQRGIVLGLMKRNADKVQQLEKLAKQYPRSDYADDALYEIARTYTVSMDNNAKGIDAYNRLLTNYPNSKLTPKAALEIGMIYANNRQYDNAIKAYKQVIGKYPGTEESYIALNGIEECYIETNRVKEYIDYTKSLKMVIKSDAGHEDSLTYVAAERQYFAGNYTSAAQSLSNYVKNYCDGGRYCALARYYMADSYYRTGQKEQALAAYKPICDQRGSQYREEACMRCAEITYDKQDFKAALTYFTKLSDAASSISNKQVARLGILRCNYQLNNYDQTIKIATEIIDDDKSASSLTDEARYNRAKAYLAKNNYTLPQPDLKLVAMDLSNQYGAEAKYELANCYYLLNDLDRAEAEVMDFAEKNTPYRYWLARSLILLADISLKRGDDFQAKQYLLSIQSNYSSHEDDIHSILEERLRLVEEREKEKIID